MSRSSELRDMYQLFAALDNDVYQLGNKHSRCIETVIQEGTTRAVTFEIAFVEIPIVVVGFADSSTEVSVCSAYDVSETGFTIGVYKVGGGANKDRTVSWIATTSGNQ